MQHIHDDFAICLSPDVPNFDSDGELPEAFRKETIQNLARHGFDPASIELRPGTVGYGADGFVLISVFAGLAALFLSGKRIEENLDAWLSLGRRFRALFDQADERVRPLAISQPVALALVLDRIGNEIHDVAGLSVVAAHVIPVRNGSLYPEYERDFERQPDRFYVFIMKLPNDDTIVTGMRSDGIVSFEHRIATGNFLEYFGIVDEGS